MMCSQLGLSMVLLAGLTLGLQAQQARPQAPGVTAAADDMAHARAGGDLGFLC